MLNPLEMNFYGTRNYGSLAYMEEILVPNETIVNPNQQSQSNVMEPNIIPNQGVNYDGGMKRDGIGKWVDPDKGNRSTIAPYPSYSMRNYPYIDNGLPQSLQELFTPMKCNLCNCIMGSAATTKDHYSGKKHKLNIRKWFLVHPEFMSQASSEYFGPTKRITDPNKLYCKYCDVMLSSEQQVESHYLGRKHQSIINSGIPKNAWFNPAQGQWERYPKGALENRHGIGLGFLEKYVVGQDPAPLQNCFCDVCMVACPSEVTYNEHISGSKHRKKVALLKKGETSSATRNSNVAEAPKRSGKPFRNSDLSIYRTPTGKYYCSTCNITVNSPTQFIEHSDSKKHKSKAVLPVAPSPSRE